jgi:hypothetical protein
MLLQQSRKEFRGKARIPIKSVLTELVEFQD